VKPNCIQDVFNPSQVEAFIPLKQEIVVQLKPVKLLGEELGMRPKLRQQQFSKCFSH
jgi:hypothetical protein